MLGDINRGFERLSWSCLLSHLLASANRIASPPFAESATLKASLTQRKGRPRKRTSQRGSTFVYQARKASLTSNGDKGTTLLCLHKMIPSSVDPILCMLLSNRILSQRFPRIDKSLKPIIAQNEQISSISLSFYTDKTLSQLPGHCQKLGGGLEDRNCT